MAVEYGIAGAGRAWGVVNANRITLHPGHIIFAIGGGGGVARGKGKTTLHPHIVRNDGRAVGLIQKGNTIFGPGAAAGTFAIAFRSIGFVGKLLAEALEEISPSPLEALNATGAPASHVLLKGAWPQIAPAFWGVALFRWDINIRESAVLGLVGAGGIGVVLDDAINFFQWDRVATILLAILLIVIVAEVIVTRLRSKLI